MKFKNIAWGSPLKTQNHHAFPRPCSIVPACVGVSKMQKPTQTAISWAVAIELMVNKAVLTERRELKT